jgi:hypothetical protein
VSSVVKMPTLRYNRVSSAVIKNAQSWTLYIIYLILVTQVITHIYNNALLKKKDGGNIS